jgi:SAM-dependent methyltransferase
LKKRSLLEGYKSVIELGSQDLHSNIKAMDEYLHEISGNMTSKLKLIDAASGYAILGISDYNCIDADGQHNAFVFDLNHNIKDEYKFDREFDVVTNFGTSEHCFNQYEVFRNMHDLCRAGGIIVAHYPTQGFINHGYYQYSPKLLIELAVANNYDILGLYLSPFRPEIYHYFPDMIDRNRDDDLGLFTVFRQSSTKSAFRAPFDGDYLENSQLTSSEYDSLKKVSWKLNRPLVVQKLNENRRGDFNDVDIDLINCDIWPNFNQITDYLNEYILNHKSENQKKFIDEYVSCCLANKNSYLLTRVLLNRFLENIYPGITIDIRNMLLEKANNECDVYKKTSLLQCINQISVNRYALYYDLLNQLLKNVNIISEYLDFHQLQKIAVYGYGEVGKRVIDIITSSKKYSIECIIDKNSKEENVIGIESLNKFDVDIVIVTPVYDYREIKSELLNVFRQTDRQTLHIESLKDIIYWKRPV